MSRLRNCPFCKKEVDGEFPYMDYNELCGKWIFSHYCDSTNGVTIDVYGFTKQEVIDKWNGVYEEQESESL